MASGLKLLPTATVNPELLHQVSGFSTLLEALEYAAYGETGLNFYDSGGQLSQVLSYKELVQQSRQIAQNFQRLGLKKGDRLALFAHNKLEFILAFFACTYIQVLPCPLPLPTQLGSMKSYTERLIAICTKAKVVGIVGNLQDQGLIDKIAPLLSFQHVVYYERLQNFILETEGEVETPKINTESPFYIQFSSGSTADPKGVVISHGGLCENICAISQGGIQINREDRAISWLPFYHNMGLCLVLCAIYTQRSCDILTPSGFIRNPLLWLKLISTNRSSITLAPIFGYRLAMAALLQQEQPLALDLSCLKAAIVGGDMVRPKILKECVQLLSPYGFGNNAFISSYGMTEASLAISSTQRGESLITDTLSGDEEWKLTETVSSGCILPRLQVEIRDKNNIVLKEREIGQIWVKGTSIISAYLDEEPKSCLDDNNFFNTGDLGYFYQQRLYVTGREKDVIIIRGRNIWAQDLEWTIEQACLQLGEANTAAFSLDDGTQENLVILSQAEIKTSVEQEQTIACAKSAIRQQYGLELVFVFVPPHSLPFTSSGKLARNIAKKMYVNQKINCTNVSFQ